ncbi:hypothetical protein C2G38_2210334 [Gigaspora rosea]|uniref:Uncharacterized protein n=1 Tax=Gigaspora rosea TaxID=44941 RepID=A0A397UF54_9GLOM|nr:hypothetical protein C2G38_2210334 [Gigaspora rosea]
MALYVNLNWARPLLIQLINVLLLFMINFLCELFLAQFKKEKLNLLQWELNLLRNNNLALRASLQRELDRNIALRRRLFDISPAFREDYWRSWRNQEPSMQTPGDI